MPPSKEQSNRQNKNQSHFSLSQCDFTLSVNKHEDVCTAIDFRESDCLCKKQMF